MRNFDYTVYANQFWDTETMNLTNLIHEYKGKQELYLRQKPVELTLLLLYKAGYNVGKYISIEKHIEKTKDAYYDALEIASADWHEEKNDPVLFIKYMLGVILACYREFENRVEMLSKPDENGKRLVKSSALDIVRAAIASRIGKFTKTEILNICPTLSRSSVEAGLRELIALGEIQRFGAGKTTYYLRSDALK